MEKEDKIFFKRFIISSIALFPIVAFNNSVLGNPFGGLVIVLPIFYLAFWSAEPYYPSAKEDLLRLVGCSNTSKDKQGDKN